MMQKKRSVGVIMIIILVLFLSSPIFAETITLKSGQKIEGKITEKTDKYIKIDIEGVLITYFMDDIDSIDDRKVSNASLVEENPVQESILIPSVKESIDKGMDYCRKGQYDEGIAEFSKAIEINPNSPVAYLNRGNAYQAKGNYNQAISDYTKAIEIDPNFVEAYYNRGLAYGHNNNLDQAIADSSKVIEIDPNYSEAYNNRALAYFYKNDYDKSWLDVHKAEELGYKVNPDFLEELKRVSGREK